MWNSTDKITRQIIGVGAIAGLRTMSALALTAAHLRQHRPRSLNNTPLQWLTSDSAVSATKLLAAGEMTADKLPEIPARIEAGPLFGRALTGALAGYILSVAYGEPGERGALLGGVAAVTSAFAGYYLRRALVETVSLPDPMVALLEDLLVIGAGTRLLDVEEVLRPRWP